MDEYRGENKIVLRGQAARAPVPSHRNHGVDYYLVPLRVPRLSGVDDMLNVVSADPALWTPGEWVSVAGEVRSYNNRTGTGSKLVITVLAREVAPSRLEEGENRLSLGGALCRRPTLRRTPLGREICDLLLAVNRPYGRADYLPCIAWGSLAAHCGALDVGDRLRLEGRLQSRQYHKLVDGEQVERTAFEVSVMNLLDSAEPS
ncbi:MAG: single-stranded DNA-binding protein [Oscillospiraceae bacterium]|jgi:single-strand DNA-binding protein|nr:single-stranded DNA-binding protein [Oscillospiraceae bacterium]MCI9551870.1 single-stranded DNA-binding protein [Oscillospiraceae bacterium]